MIITIDGPSGTGKTTVARRVAEKLGFVYFDTGAMYRALTWLVLEKNIDPKDPQAIQSLLPFFDFKIEEEQCLKRYYIGSSDVTEVIRSRWITTHVSQVAAQKPVRSALLEIQHRFAENKNVIFEGRDLGTIVFPLAEVKIYLHADPQVRAERRLQEMQDKNPQDAKQLNFQMMLDEIMQRDEFDSNREVAPLRCPPDAHRVDTSQLTLDQVVHQIVETVQRVRVGSVDR